MARPSMYGAQERRISMTIAFWPPSHSLTRVSHLFPDRRTLAFSPFPSRRVVLEIPILIPISLLQELQKRVAQGRIHSHSLSWVVAAYTVARKALFEKRFLECTSTVEIPRRGITRWVCPTFTPRVVPRTKCVPCTVEGTENLLAGLCASLP